jgi:hypothetical protein
VLLQEAKFFTQSLDVGLQVSFIASPLPSRG